MATTQNSQTPSSMEEVEALVLQLYRPGTPALIAQTQETLQSLQRSPEGWRIAHGFINHQNEQVRFFAALTFIVKLNTDAASLGEDDARALLDTLLGWLVQSMENSEGALVTRKLCSTLVAYFLQFSLSWTNCVNHIIYCLCVSKAMPYSALDDAPELAPLLQNLPDAKSVAVFWFAATLVEEVGRMDSKSMREHEFHQRVVPNAEPIVHLISKYIIESSPTADEKVRQEALTCYQAWVTYAHRAYIDAEIMLEPLRDLIKPALMCLADDNLYETTVELFTEVLTSYSKFLRKEDFELLHSLFSSPWAHARYDRLIQGDFDFDSLQFGMLMIAFGDATVVELTKNATNPTYNRLLTGLAGLLAADGHAVAEDKIYVPALEFWGTFVETMVDDLYGQEDGHGSPSWFPAAQAHVRQVIENCWRKSQFPSASIFNSWDSVDRTGFKDARRDFSDILQQFYLTTGIPLLQIFTEKLHEYTPTKSWPEVEASMFCLSCFADSVAENPQRDDYFDKVFDTSILALFASTENGIPTRVMKGFLDLVISYSDYFQRRPAQLPVLLNIVFEATSSLSLAKTAARAIMKICSDCRAILLPELGSFLHHYGTIASNDTLEPGVKGAILEGISSIIQTMDSDEAKVVALNRLLDYVEADVRRCLETLSSNPDQLSKTPGIGLSNLSQSVPTALDLGLLALKCLAGIASGSQVPDDKPVDLEEDHTQSTFWTSGSGQALQHRIYSIICQVYDSLGMHGDIVEEVCHLWRLGFRETEPGPFVFPPSVAAQFFTKTNLQTPRLVKVITTSNLLISNRKPYAGLDQILLELLTWVTNILQILGDPSNDPEISQPGIIFLQRLVSEFPLIFLTYQSPACLEYLLMFALKALAGTDPLPKAAAADFWATFIGLQSTGDIQGLMENAVAQVGPLLAQAIIYNIGGNAQRSELDKLCEPLKKLVTRQVHAQKWLEAALLADNFPSDKVDAKERLIFLKKITSLRGGRGTNQVVKDFWLSCRGTSFSYAS